MNLAKELEELQRSLRYSFKNPRLLVQALVHRSFDHENPDISQKDNEILEFLGDAVLSLAVSHLLVESFPDSKEGELSRFRSAIVNERELARIAQELNLGQCLLLGKGEELTGGRKKPSLLADTLEALLAAIYLDGGLDAAIRVVRRFFHAYLHLGQMEQVLKTLDRDFKTQLQEFTQARFRLTPVYHLEDEKGPDHHKVFFMRVTLNGRVLARGSGRSKKDAQQEAAQKALEIIGMQGPWEEE